MHRRRNGGIETNVYNNRGLLTQFTDAEGNLTKYTYDTADRLASSTDARNNITRNEYNNRGLLTKSINADGSFETFAYDDFGNRSIVANEIGNSWKTIYDEFKRPDSLIDPLGRLTRYQYDLPGGVCGCSHDNSNPTSVISACGKVVTFEYDVEWQKLSQTAGVGTPDAATTFYEYDLVGNVVTMISPNGKSLINEYDDRNRRKSSTDALGNKTQWTYDIAGNVKTIIRPDLETTAYEYDDMNRVTQTTDPKGQVTKMKFDNEGNVIRMTDPKSRNYNFQYDLLNRQTKLLYPGGSFEDFIYDRVGNVIKHTNRAGDVRTYTYDNRNREIKSHWSDNTPAILSSYDEASRLLTLSNSASEVTYTYDKADELISETQYINGSGGAKTVKYAYNQDRLQNELTYPDGTIIHYEYTERSQIKTISDAGTGIATYTYDRNGNRLKKSLQNGTSTDYSYDDVNKLLLINHQKAGVSFGRFDYGYDNVDRRIFTKRNGSKGDVYAYDATDQITNVQYDVLNPEAIPLNPLRKVNYQWDASGNRTTVSDNNIETNYTTNNRNQYTNINGNQINYTPNGNLRNSKGWTFTYDAQDRLIRARNNSVTIKLTYDARNRCVSREINNNISFFYYDNWFLVEETNGRGAQIAEYVHGSQIDEILRKSVARDTVYYHQDAIGSVSHLTNPSGNVVEQYSYDVFGAVTIKNGAGNVIASTAFANRFLFTGREFIRQIDLYDFRNRMYSAELGRFLQTDPMLFDAGDYNLYRYVFNSPTNAIDPYGFECCCACVNSVKIQNVKPYTNARFGHSFDVEIKLEYKKAKADADATLDWSEKMDVSPKFYLEIPGYKPGEWNNMYSLYSKSSVFDPWKNRKKPCPGEETVVLTDPPGIAFRPGTERERTLSFKITVTSAPDCDCKNKSLSVTATQILKTSKDGKSAATQDFNTP